MPLGSGNVVNSYGYFYDSISYKSMWKVESGNIFIELLIDIYLFVIARIFL